MTSSAAWTSADTSYQIFDVISVNQGRRVVFHQQYLLAIRLKMVTAASEESRAFIKCCAKIGYTASETYKLLQKAGSTSDMKRATVFKWFSRFKEGRESLRDDKRGGRPMVINATLVTSVKEFIEEDRRRTVREAAEAIDTSYGTVRTILHDYLNMNRICARWVPKLLSTDEQNRRVDVSRQFLRRHAREGDEFLKRIITCDETWLWLFDPETKQQSSQWRETSSPPPTKARVSKSGGKYMFVMFADREGMLLCHAVPPTATVNSDYYSKVNNLKFP